MISWTPSSLIQPGQMNRLSVVAEGTSFYFYINNQYVDDYTDSKLSSGKVALVIGLNDEGDSATFEFDNFDVRGP